MSIHKSKGLEFPVVFLCNTSKKFNLKDLNDNIILHQDLGFGPKYINYEKRIEYNTLAKEAIKIKNKTETMSEEMRVLYVALTRAKEKLYITGTSKDLQEELKQKEANLNMYKKEEKININLLKKCNSYLDWIELVYLENKEEMKKILNLYEYENGKMQTEIIKPIKNEIEKLLETKPDNKKIEDIESTLNWKYKYTFAETIPTKTSVSKIKEENNSKLKLENFLQKEEITYAQNLEIPKFAKEEKITNAQKGTLIHLCIKNMDEKNDYTLEELKKLVRKLKDKELITEEEEKVVNLNTLLQYAKSDLYRNLKNAKEVHKEEPFYINIPANKIYNEILNNNEISEKVLVQGIIDLYYIDQNDKLILVDYKTDYVENNNEKILIEKYKEQLRIYKEALEKALNRKVDKTIIYSTYIRKEIVIEQW